MKVIICIAFCLVCVYGETPEFFIKCKRDDPQLEQCFLKGVEDIRPVLKNGVPEFNIPALDPFTLPRLKLNRTAPNLRIKAIIKQTTAYGASDFQIKKLRIAKDKLSLETKLFFPGLFVVTDYDVRGSKVLELELTGHGNLRGNISNVQVIVKGNANPITKEGVEYLQIDKVVIRTRVGHAHFTVDPSSGLATTAAVQLFNSNPRPILDIINPLIEETAAAVVKAMGNKILAAIPYKDIFVD